MDHLKVEIGNEEAGHLAGDICSNTLNGEPSLHYRRGVPILCSPTSEHRPILFSALALKLFFDNILLHLLSKLKSATICLSRLFSSFIGEVHATPKHPIHHTFSSKVKRKLANPHLAADFLHLKSRLRLLERKYDLRFGKF